MSGQKSKVGIETLIQQIFAVRSTLETDNDMHDLLLQVREALQYMRETSQLATQQLELSQATVTRVQQLGMGDRQVCSSSGLLSLQSCMYTCLTLCSRS